MDINNPRDQAEEILLKAAQMPAKELLHRLRVLITAAMLQHEALMDGTMDAVARINPGHCEDCAKDSEQAAWALRLIERDIQKLRLASILVDEITSYDVPDLDALKASYARLRDRADRETLEEVLKKS